MPPSCAMTIAMSASVTVSIADGDHRDVERDRRGSARVRVSRLLGRMSLSRRTQQHVVESQAEGDVVDVPLVRAFAGGFVAAHVTSAAARG